MVEYKVVHNVKELKESAADGYEFVAIITQNDWLMEKRPQLYLAENIDLDESFVAEDALSDPDIEKINVEGSESIKNPKTIKQLKDGEASNSKSTR